MDNVRLLCKSHNQFEAERVFGTGFMSEKREAAQRAAEAARNRSTATEAARTRANAVQATAFESGTTAETSPLAASNEHTHDAMACLRELGFRADEARRAIASSVIIPAATLEERVRAALKFLCPKPGARLRSA